MQDFYEVDISGRKESLPVLTLPSGAGIAFFNLHGNQELTEFCAEKLAEKIRDAEVIVTAESKGLQLAHCVARILGHKFYAVARKSKKLYMQDGISVKVNSITTEGEQRLYLSGSDALLLKGKKVAIVDDVISTGGSLNGLADLVRLAGGEILYKACVLTEGTAKDKNGIISLGHIPIFS